MTVPSREPSPFPAAADRLKKLEVACAIIERDGLVLAAQRSATMSMPNKWEFPGGKLEAGESAADCLKREIAEELGVSIVIGTALPPCDWQYPTFAITLNPFVCSLGEGEVALAEHQALCWVAPEELPSLDWPAADLPVLQYYLGYLRTRSGGGG